MDRLWLRIQAPFAAYRPLQAGSLRVTAPVMTYSAAWGMLLNLAGIETRAGLHQPVTGLRQDLPALRLALGLPGVEPGRACLLQQLHAYPVGSASKVLAEKCKGAKYHIAPVRREFLVGLDLVLGVEGAPCGRILAGLSGQLQGARYGLPFAGDNNLLFDRIDVVPSPPPCRWYAAFDPLGAPVRGATRLTTTMDRADSSRTQAALVAPTPAPSEAPPENAWQWVPEPPGP
jgi:CRISPR-associated protein Cas5t